MPRTKQLKRPAKRLPKQADKAPFGCAVLPCPHQAASSAALCRRGRWSAAPCWRRGRCRRPPWGQPAPAPHTSARMQGRGAGESSPGGQQRYRLGALPNECGKSRGQEGCGIQAHAGRVFPLVKRPTLVSAVNRGLAASTAARAASSAPAPASSSVTWQGEEERHTCYRQTGFRVWVCIRGRRADEAAAREHGGGINGAASRPRKPMPHLQGSCRCAPRSCVSVSVARRIQQNSGARGRERFCAPGAQHPLGAGRSTHLAQVVDFCIPPLSSADR